MSQQTTRLQMPFLQSGQAQKHVTVNESLLRLDALVQLAAKSATTTAQPASPSDGDIYILPSGKTGADWGAMANGALAYYRDGAWESLSPREGYVAHVADADQIVIYSGTAWQPLLAALGGWRVLAQSSVAVTLTGSTAETALATIVVPGGAMGANGRLRVSALWSITNNANNKTLRARLGGLAGVAFQSVALTASASFRSQCEIANRNNQAIQVGANASLGGGGWSATGAAVTTATVNTATAANLVLSGQLANASDSVVLEGYLVELAYGA
jgi:hypothetical protein